LKAFAKIVAIALEIDSITGYSLGEAKGGFCRMMRGSRMAYFAAEEKDKIRLYSARLFYSAIFKEIYGFSICER
jgi:hypothetical protein